MKLRTPLDKDFHCRVHAYACKLYNRAAEDQQPLLPASQIDSHNWEIKEIVGHRWDSDPRRKVFRARFMYPPHNVPELDEWFVGDDLNATKLISAYKTLLKQGVRFTDGVAILPTGQANASNRASRMVRRSVRPAPSGTSGAVRQDPR